VKQRSENAERSFSNAACREENIVGNARNIEMINTETFYKLVMMIWVELNLFKTDSNSKIQ
jgi:hypothetical protein